MSHLLPRAARLGQSRAVWLLGFAILALGLAYLPVAPPARTYAAGAPKAYVGLFQDNAVAVLETGTNRLLSTIPVPTGPHGLVVTPDGGRVYVSSDGASTVSVIDTGADQVAATVEVGQAPHGLAITPDGRQVLAAVFGADAVAFVDTATARVVGQVAVPSPHNIAISPDGRTAYVAAQGQGALSLAVLDVPSRTQVGSVPLEKTPRALSFSPDGKWLYFTQAGVDAVVVLDPATNQIVAQVPVGASPHHPLFTPSGEYGLVVSQGPNELAILAPSSNTVAAVVPVGAQPHWIAVDADGDTAYVTNEGSDDVSVVDLPSRRVTATIPVGHAPRKIVLQPEPAGYARLTSVGARRGIVPLRLADEAAQAGVESRIAGLAFEPLLTVAPGQTVTWTNGDSVPHTVTSADRLWDSGRLAGGSSYSVTFDQPGTFAYACTIHPFMRGTVVVGG
jgi:YVTN family beta-propeller protein